MKRTEMNEAGYRANRMAIAMREQGDMEAAERWMQLAEYYWNVASRMPRGD